MHNNGKNAKDEISKLYSMIEDFNTSGRRDGSILYSDQHTTTIGSLINEKSILQPQNGSHVNSKTYDRSKRALKLAN